MSFLVLNSQVNSSAHAPSQSPASGQPLFCWPEALSPFTQASRAPATRATSLPPPPFWGQQGPEQPSTRRTGLPAQEMPGAFCPRNPLPPCRCPASTSWAVWCCSRLAVGGVPHMCPGGAFPPPALSSVSAHHSPKGPQHYLRKVEAIRSTTVHFSYFGLPS